MTNAVRVGVIMGSDSDWSVMQDAATALAEFDIPAEVRVISAHRTPGVMFDYARDAADRGIEVIIAGAGGAAHLPGIGQENFNTLSTLAQLQEANGKPDDAKKTMEKALADPTATPIQIHLYARQLLAQGKKDEAMKVFELNAKRYPDVWPVHVGLARGYAALGKNKEALAEARLAVKQAPDEGNRKSLEGMIKQLEETTKGN